MKDKEKKHYSKREIEKMFKYVQKDMELSNQEYDIFCEGLFCIPRETLDDIKKDVYFVILSSCRVGRKKLSPACWISRENFENKRGIIFLSESFFKYEARKDLLTEKVTTDFCNIFALRKEILHEAAHYYKKHKGTLNKNKYDEQENEAKAQAKDWLDNCKWSEK